MNYIGTQSGIFNSIYIGFGQNGRYGTNFNLAVGTNNLLSNTTGSGNTVFGINSLGANTTGGNNISIGPSSLVNNSTGGNNIGMGIQSLYFNTTGNRNVGIGIQTLTNNSTGNDNVSVGFQSLYNITTSNNTSIGSFAGAYIKGATISNATSSNSIYIGFQTYPLSSGDTNEIVIGYQAVGNGSNTTVIGNSKESNKKLTAISAKP